MSYQLSSIDREPAPSGMLQVNALSAKEPTGWEGISVFSAFSLAEHHHMQIFGRVLQTKLPDSAIRVVAFWTGLVQAYQECKKVSSPAIQLKFEDYPNYRNASVFAVFSRSAWMIIQFFLASQASGPFQNPLSRKIQWQLSQM